MVKKKDGAVRICIDFRVLNKHTQYDAEPIPDCGDLSSRLQGTTYFTRIDLTKGCWQIRRTKRIDIRPLRMPSGLITASMTFARMMRMLNLEEKKVLIFSVTSWSLQIPGKRIQLEQQRS